MKKRAESRKLRAPAISARECIVASRPHMTALVKEFGCTAHGLRIACNGEHDPHVFGCTDVTAAGCATCFNHKEAFENVCVWCKTDSQCHDVGSLEDPCSNDQCISIAVKVSVHHAKETSHESEYASTDLRFVPPLPAPPRTAGRQSIARPRAPTTTSPIAQRGAESVKGRDHCAACSNRPVRYVQIGLRPFRAQQAPRPARELGSASGLFWRIPCSPLPLTTAWAGPLCFPIS